MIRNLTSHDKTNYINKQSTAWMMHEKEQTTCASCDNAQETHNDLSWLIHTTIYKLEHDLRTFKMI